MNPTKNYNCRIVIVPFLSKIYTNYNLCILSNNEAYNSSLFHFKDIKKTLVLVFFRQSEKHHYKFTQIKGKIRCQTQDTTNDTKPNNVGIIGCVWFCKI